MNDVRVAASLLSADPLRLREEALSVKEAGVQLLHLDVMDGHFVPPLTYGPGVAEGLWALGIPLDVHLMVNCLDYAVPAFAPFSACLTVHAEATAHLHRVLQDIRERGCKTGMALNPATSPDFLPHVIDLVDLVLVMTVNPGWGGQSYIPEMVDKVAWVKSLIARQRRHIDVEVDGGITGDNAAALIEAGADILVSGSYLFRAPDRRKAVASLTALSPR
jgi:ribulose-phosphate 3-epimerase